MLDNILDNISAELATIKKTRKKTLFVLGNEKVWLTDSIPQNPLKCKK
ncbi:hypothetical protein HMPREF0556_10497 [Listeria grayi DSM 20601]|uniref:Uncharacterized protein n=1 Tax=Listeria grayi DSM 20601 TaxID=525367 RepID=D7UVT6_LISGR|nr:hypothetical protein HMPREF0556_10497 [Listeria grayi DSM 20601]